MTIKPNILSTFIRLPDPPEPEDMNNHVYFNSLGNALHLARHFGNEDTTIIMAGVYVSRVPTGNRRGLFEPDLLIAFNTDPAACIARNGYVIEEQGKPPDFVLEIGSASTGRRDVTVKREGYAALGIPEYWRFDPSGGQFQGAPLAGDRLVDELYEPITITQINNEHFQGHSNALNLDLHWERGQLGWYDPETQRHIIRFDDERATRIAQTQQLTAEVKGRLASEARVRQLEEELRRLRDQ